MKAERSCAIRPCLICAVLAVLVAGCGLHSTVMPADAGVSLREAERDFTYRGEAIHPGLVQEFAGRMSDGGPITTAVDVRAAYATDEYGSEPQKAGDWTTITQQVAGADRTEWFGYQRLGALRDRTQVLLTAFNGGGSGVFESIVFVRFRVQPHTRKDGQADYRLVMEVVRECPIGDRDDGQISVMNDYVLLGASKYRTTPRILRPGS